jgi:transcriptional regulator with XRE-family HTH domain
LQIAGRVFSLRSLEVRPMDRQASPVVRRRQLAGRLRHLRLQANLTLEEAAQAIEASAATLSRIENGVRVPRGRDVRDLLARYGVQDQSLVTNLMNLAAGARESGWWEAYSEVDDEYATYIGLETAATQIHECESAVVPAILQTEQYARSYFSDAVNPTRASPFSRHDIDRRIEVRLTRQKLLDSDTGLAYSAIIDASVLSRTVGNAAVMRTQIGHLLEVSDRDNVNIHLVPLDQGGYPGQLGGFTILTLPRDLSDVVYIDTLAGQLFLESQDEVARHRRAFDAALAKALTKECSQARMATLYEE